MGSGTSKVREGAADAAARTGSGNNDDEAAAAAPAVSPPPSPLPSPRRPDAIPAEEKDAPSASSKSADAVPADAVRQASRTPQKLGSVPPPPRGPKPDRLTRRKSRKKAAKDKKKKKAAAAAAAAAYAATKPNAGGEGLVDELDPDASYDSSQPHQPPSRPRPPSTLAPHFAISMDDLEILQAVGEGGFCRVHKARFVKDRSIVAVKKLKGLNNPDPKVLESFTKEIELHSRIRHPHVIQFFGGCTVPPNLCLVTEFMFCSLQHALDNDPGAFHPQFEVETALSVALGLNHLHCLNIIHRDLKASNVLVDRNYCNPKIADFGLSRVKLAIGESMTRGVGSPFAMAPEVITSSKYTQAVDWYAYGVLVWQLVTKKHPYVGMKQMEIIKHVVHEDKRLPFGDDDHAHPILRDIVERCWLKDPAARPSFDEVAKGLEELTTILEGSMLGAMAREAVQDAYPSELGGTFVVTDGDRETKDSPAVAAAITAAAGARGGGGTGGAGAAAAGGAGEGDGEIEDMAQFDEMDFLDQTLTWDDVRELEQKINIQEMQVRGTVFAPRTRVCLGVVACG